jgi:hypothetical protein
MQSPNVISLQRDLIENIHHQFTNAAVIPNHREPEIRGRDLGEQSDKSSLGREAREINIVTVHDIRWLATDCVHIIRKLSILTDEVIVHVELARVGLSRKPV